MDKISSRHVKKMLKQETAVLYGPTSQRVRLEWRTETGGTLNKPHNIYVGATITVNVLDNVVAIFGSFKSDQRERINLDRLALSIDQLGFWYFANNLQLADKNNLLILQHIKDKYYSGNGTGSGSVWTPDTDPSWTADEWIGRWLVFPDRRFKITDNGTESLTADLTSDPKDGGNILPTSSTQGKIMGLAEWYPVRNNLALQAGAIAPLETEMIFQAVFCSRIPIAGR